MEVIVTNLIGKPRRVSWNGRSYFVAPITSIVPGVLAGSQGPLFYPPDEVSRNPDAWNGMPLVLYHPTHNGKPVSARSPLILEKHGLGYVYESRFGGKLQHEGWFDEEWTRNADRRFGTDVLPRLEAGQPIEMSTGLFTDNEPHEERTHNGRGYSYTARNYRPDHIAALPGMTGACSVRDGCGININAATCPECGYALTAAEREAGACKHCGAELPPVENAFCATGAGGGVDPSCGADGGGRVESARAKYQAARDAAKTARREAFEGAKADAAAANDKAHKDFDAVREAHDNVAAVDDSKDRGHKQFAKAYTKVDELVTSYDKDASAAERFDHLKAIEKAAAKAADRNGALKPGAGDDTLTADELKGNTGHLQTIIDRARSARGHIRTYASHRKEMREISEITGNEWDGEDLDLPPDDAPATGPPPLGLLHRFLGWLTANAGLGQPKSTATGKWKRYGSGTGKGAAHEAAQRGAMTLTEQDRTRGADAKAQADAGREPPSWAANQAVWERAKEAARKGDYEEGGDAFWAAVSHIYRNMGGTIEGATENAADEAAEPAEVTVNSAQGESAMNRQDTVRWLVVNCDCYKGKQKLLENQEAFSDDDLKKLKANAEKAAEQEAVVNAVREAGGAELTVNAMPEFIKKKIKAKEEDEEEEEEETPKKKKKATENAAAPPPAKPPTAEEWFKAAPPEIQSAVRNAMNVERQEREKLVRQLTANVADDKREAAAKKLSGKSLEELRDLLDLLPTANRQQDNPFAPSYYGAAGGPTDNAGYEAELLDLPVMNWDVADDKKAAAV